MERIAALVEGHTEVHFMRSTYSNVIVSRPFPNGKSVSLDLIVDSICDRLEVIDGSISKVVVLLDREDRSESAHEVREYILSKLVERGCTRQIYLGVADREIENWILADEELITAKYGVNDYRYAGDATRGKKGLAILHGSDQAPQDKARLLKACKASRAGGASESLAALLSQVDFGWAWAAA